MTKGVAEIRGIEIYMDIICVPIIASIVFSIIEFYKKATEGFSRKEIFLRMIPLLSAGIGIILGIVCFYIFPHVMGSDDIIAAVLVGGASGLSATGCNQVFKQLHKFGIEVVEQMNNPNDE